mmetsp:Transcript_32609/g.72023  ORF Transcript_32609/g.72023 Transcript_32609/m.72023 type:complete len:528 (-) Transcript_32609:921-2504(-)|eukprot:CAMPEP_0202895380 /NCGR_PEP_ID=MMETSP1392-20130828/4601_1 /ASSEMBLY_ACC=CAM_ASM_000868 /TAXON_ID=225041 /ORGANISM="Chlamydomonas chlamydogama, Strain SAG 11-48b" /LENGTH=527 /DNA_ID=CAMNT_0049580379 /DNA_START=51 /DNA_END=1634 /DNA_ORIENTATION=-
MSSESSGSPDQTNQHAQSQESNGALMEASSSDSAPTSEKSAPNAGTDGNAGASTGGQLDYEALYERVKDNPCKVANVDRVYETKGVPLRTKAHIIDRELDKIFEANTLGEIHAALEEAGRNLSQLQVFRKVHMIVSEEPEDNDEACTVHVDMEEKNWYKAHAATYLQGNESTCEIGVGLHGATGHAEHITVSGEYGSEKSNQFAVNYEQPRIGGLPLTLHARLHKYFQNNQKASSYTEEMRGGLIGIKSSDGTHALQYELGWRKLLDPSLQASRAVRAQVGDYLKSSLKYTLMLDGRQLHQASGQLAGWALKSSSEVCGLGPVAGLRYAKQQVDAAVVLPVNSRVALNLSASAGIMLPWGEGWQGKATCIADRFFLGGPATLRGFKYKGVGESDARRPLTRNTATSSSSEETAAPTVKRDALGGDLFLSVLAALTFQLPHEAFRALGLHGHVFVNGGNNVQLTGAGRPIRDSVHAFTTSLRWSIGTGLVLPTWFGRFEANYVMVLTHQENDRIKRGLQLGFSASPLI